MKKFNLKVAACTTLLSTFLVACDDTADKIIDKTDTNNSTSISYLNALDESVSFYLQSSIYSADVFESKFKTVELLPAEVSRVLKHDWIEGASESVFAIENSITTGSRVSSTIDINNNVDYWTVAWKFVDENKLSIFKKNVNDKPGRYSVRLFTTSEMTVKQSSSNDTLATTKPGVVTTSFEVEGCLDLMVGDNEIDLCQIGTLGKSYLAVVSIDGQIVVAQE